MTPLTIFMCTLKFISETNFRKNILHFQQDVAIVGSNENESNSTPFIATLIYPVTSSTSSCDYNVLWRVSFSSLHLIIQEAKLSITKIQIGSSSSFTEVFMTRYPFFGKYDMFLHIPIVSKEVVDDIAKELESNAASDAAVKKLHDLSLATADGMGDWGEFLYASRKIHELTVMALGNRAFVVHTMPEPIRSDERYIKYKYMYPSTYYL